MSNRPETARDEACAMVLAAFRNNTLLEDIHAGAPLTQEAMKTLMTQACDNLQALLYLRDTLGQEEWSFLLDRVSLAEWQKWTTGDEDWQRRSLEAMRAFVTLADSLSKGAFSKSPS